MINHRRPKILMVLGPTATGKTKLAVKLAKKFNGEIISADSRQVYKGMDIGSGKDLKEYGETAYHLIDIISPKKNFSVADWQKLAYKKIDDILSRGKLPIVCGGTGLYISSIVEAYSFPVGEASKQKAIRNKLSKLTLQALLKRLEKIDPETFKIVDKKNRRRVERALEIFYQTGKTKFSQSRKQKPKYDFLILGLTFSKDILESRINKRLRVRLNNQGMIDEVKKLKQTGLTWKKLEDFGLEYRFIAFYLQNKISYDEMVPQLQKAIVNFAKRQMTWFKRNKNIHWINNHNEAVKLTKEYFF